MYYVYVLHSIKDRNRFYTGSTKDLDKRLYDHNLGKSTHTNKFIPWEIYCYFAFKDHLKAESFELYLKSASGRRFLKRHC